MALQSRYHFLVAGTACITFDRAIMRYSPGFYLIFIILLAAQAVAFPQTADRIRIDSAGQSRFTAVEGGIISHFWQGVRITRGEATLTADSAVYYENRDRLEMFGQVSIVEQERSLDADTLFYDHKSRLAEAFGNVVIRDYDRHVRLDGGRAQVYEETENLILWQQPRLIMDFDLARLQTFVLADTIKYFAAEQTLTATDSVRITQGTLEATSDAATFYTDKEQFLLTGNVKARQRLNTLTGEQMTMFSKEKVLQRIELEDGGEAIFRQRAKSDSVAYNESRLLATAINFHFSNDQLELIRAAGNSYIYYTPSPADTVARGENVASGDSTIIYFSDTNLDSAFVITSAEGTYLSEPEYDSLGAIVKADTINYQADRIAFMFDADLINLTHMAQVKQGSVQLDADRIRYDIGNKTLNAHAAVDSTGETVPLVLQDGGQEIEGEELAFDLDSKRGKIRHSRTMQDKHVYEGETLRKEEDNVFLVDGSIYIPCDLENPGFHFDLGRTKVQTGEKVWARPVVLYIETIPVLAVPYFVFSTKKGRHSGFTTFQLGNFEQGQRFVNNLGYYWALSEYFDLKTTVDVSESAGLKFNGGLRYALRYKLSGYVEGSYSRESSFINYERVHPIRWSFNFSHDQTLDPSLTLRGSGNFVSDNRYTTDYSTDLQERLNRNLRSQLNLNKRWDWGSFTAFVQQNKGLDDGSHSENLPQLRFSLSTRPILSAPEDAADRRWYHDVRYGYSANFDNQSSKSVSNDVATRKKQSTLQHTLSVSASPKLAGILTLSPSLTLRDYWYYLPYTDLAAEDSLETNALKNRQTWTSSMGLSTVLYGTFMANRAGIVGLRHIMTPSATFSYTPEFTRNKEYASFTAVGTSGSESRRVSFSLRNQFQLKYRKGEQERKLTLFNLDLSASHDFLNDERAWSNISTSLRSPTVANFSMQVSMTHDPYQPETGELRWWSPYLKTVSISSNYSGAIQIPTGSPTRPEFLAAGEQGIGSQLRFSVSQRYTENRSSTVTSISHWIDFRFSFSPTPKWDVQYSQNYNLREKESTDKVIRVSRDLHCWEGSFSWIPTGSRKGYYFKINARLLPDLKFEKSESGIRDALF